MAILLFLAVLFSVLWLYFLAWVVLHELGHALAVLATQPGPIAVYFGSHGDAASSGQLRLGRLHLYFRRNVLNWRGGLCRYTPPAGQAPWRRSAVLLAGSVLPLLVAGAALLGAFGFGNGLAQELACLFAVVTVLPLTVANLLPRRRPIALADGRQVHSDGTLLWWQLRRKPLPPAPPSVPQLHAQAIELFGQQQYAESARTFRELLPRAVPTAALLRAAATACHWATDYAAALGLREQLAQQFGAELTEEDAFQVGLLYSLSDQHERALAAYTALLERPVPYPPARSNRGYTYSLLGRYELALADFDQVLAAEPANGYAHCQRGLALVRQGHEAAGLAALQTGLQLDAANAYNQLAMGLYHLGRHEHAAALGCFERAHALDPRAHRLAGYLQQTRQLLEAPSETDGL